MLNKEANPWIKASERPPGQYSDKHFRDAKSKDTIAAGTAHIRIKNGDGDRVEWLDEELLALALSELQLGKRVIVDLQSQLLGKIDKLEAARKENERLMGLLKEAVYAGWYNGMVEATRHEYAWKEFQEKNNLKPAQ